MTTPDTQQLIEALEPCPLCGLAAEIWRAHPENPKRKAWIACTGKCCIMTREYLTDEEAIAAWNTRARSADERPTPPDDLVEVVAWSDVIAERRRQVQDEGWAPEHDDEHDAGELAGAGAAYALNAGCLLYPFNGTPLDEPPECWMWDRAWWKPQTDPDSARRDLVKAAALIVAEIERIDRAISRHGDHISGEGR